ncbi:MAG: YfhO family protein [Bacteroidales bacterium]|nr:YfhO family protein [Bacteroidales bacterium]
MAYYLFMMIGVCFFAELAIHAKEKRWKDFGIATLLFVLSVGIGIGSGSSHYFANAEYTEQTMRGGHSDLVKEGEASASTNSNGLDIDYATQWSYGIDESFSFLIPGFKGGSSNYTLGKSSHTYKAAVALGLPTRSVKEFVKALPLYWGDQPFTAGNVYMGAIVCFLFLLGCLIVKGPYKWALLVSTLFSVMLAWGSNFMWLTELFFNHFPLYNKFRAVSSILVVAEIAMPLLGFLALKALVDGSVPKEKARKSIFIAGGITAGLCLFFALFGKSIYSFEAPRDAMYLAQLPPTIIAAIQADRAALLTGDAWRSFAFIVAAVALIFFFNEKKLKFVPLTIGLGVLILVDMWPVDKRYFNDNFFVPTTSKEAIFEKQPWEEILLEDPDPHFRIMNRTTNTFNESRSSYWLKSIGGYHAAKLRRYQDLIDEHLNPMHMPVIGMLNAKYIIAADEDGQPEIWRNPYALGNAWFVDSLVIADGAREESDALNEIELSHTAVLDKTFADHVSNTQPGIAPDAEVHLTAYTPKQLDYDYTTSQPGTIVFSEIYYPYGWKASIDGAPVDHYRVNYTLRALNVPAGEHHITFLFDPDSVRKGDRIATICIVIMYLTILAAIGLGCMSLVRKKQNAA